MNLEWAVQHTLVSRWGELDINIPDPTTGRKYFIDPTSYKMIPTLRVTQDHISQEDGSVLHPRWKSGVTVIMQVSLLVVANPADPACADYVPACESDMREMEQTLLLHLNAMRKLETNPQRLRWAPAGYGDERLLDDVQLLNIWDPSYDLGGTEAMIQFALESPFPYGIDATEISTAVGTGSTGGGHNVTNAGNCPQSPVVQVTGPCNAFTLTNNNDLDNLGNPKSVVYDQTRPGAVHIPTGHYAEIDFFRGTIYMDGNGANLVAGLDPTLTDFWKLQHGTNDIEIVGADCVVLSNNAWA